ncbi:MAG: agmatinase [Alphaproteobacteria bacterium]
MTEDTSVPGDHAFTADSLYGTVAQPAYAGAASFMRRKYTRDLAGVDVAVSGIPFDLATTNRPGTRFGPLGIRQASKQLSYGGVWPWGFDPFDRLAVIDHGDCHFDLGNTDAMLAAVEAHATGIIEAGVSMLTFGGDHFISLPLLRAHAKKFGPLSLVHFDAHSDTWREAAYHHGTMFFHAIGEGLIDPERSIHIGIRSDNPESHGFTILDAPWVHDNGTAAVIAEIERVAGGHKAYLTFDIDCLDPSCAPGTGTPVVGGLTAHQAQSILRGLGSMDFVAMDLVEVAPIYDVGEITSLAAAALALDYLCLRAAELPPVSAGSS